MVVDEKAQIQELREKFLEKLKEDETTNFHAADVERVSSSDDWLRRFLEHNEYNLQDSFKMLWEACEWRRNFGTNDIDEKNVRMDYLEHGVCFAYGKDIDGKKLFVIKSKLHTKGSKDFAELQRCIVYWFERLEREGNGDQISLFFDMIDVGISNIDMELTKYLIGLFKNYYPNFLNYIIILEMHWLLNATFNIIKSWLPAKAIPKIKFVKKSTLKEYVDPSVALKCWGGTNEYIFQFVSEAHSNGLVNGKADSKKVSILIKKEVLKNGIKKKVHFAENSPLIEQPVVNFSDKQPSQALLFIEPEVLLSFKKSGADSLSTTITLKNNSSDCNLTYKIKTTSPDKFKVRPNTGILLPAQSVVVTIFLQSSYDSRSLAPSDRFLIMSLPIENKEMANNELIDFWKNNETTAEEHRLICRLGGGSFEGLKSSLVQNDTENDNMLEKIFTKISQLQDEQVQLKNSISSLKHSLIILGTFLILFLAWFVYSLNSFKNGVQNPVSENQILSSVVEPVVQQHDEI